MRRLAQRLSLMKRQSALGIGVMNRCIHSIDIFWRSMDDWTFKGKAMNLANPIFFSFSLRIQTLSGNTDQDTVIRHELRPFNAKYVRFRPQGSSGHVAMRVEIYACPLRK